MNKKHSDYENTELYKTTVAQYSKSCGERHAKQIAYQMCAQKDEAQNPSKWVRDSGDYTNDAEGRYL